MSGIWRVAVAFGALAATVSGALAGGSGSSLELKTEYFWDRNRVWNYTPAMVLKLALSRKWTLGWEQEFDVVSGASRRIGYDKIGLTGGQAYDAVSGASKIEVRHSENPSLTYADKGTVLSGSFYSSRENDYTSLSPAVSVSQDFNDRNTTFGGSWSEYFDDFRPRGAFAKANGAPPGGTKRIRTLGVTAAQSLTSLTLIGATATWVDSWGYLGHPYNPPMDVGGTFLSEIVPDRKQSGALSAQIVQGWHLGEMLGSANLEVRRYQDQWGLKSSTADLKLDQYLAEGLFLRLRGRYYQQTGTFFAKDYYTGTEPYRTADIRFFPFKSYLVGAKLSGPFPDSWGESAFLPDRWDIKYDQTLRNTHGDPDAVEGQPRSYRYQLYDADEFYLQGVLMAGLVFNL